MNYYGLVLEKNNQTNSILSLVEKIVDFLPEKNNSPLKITLVGGAAIWFYCENNNYNEVNAIFSQKILLPQISIPLYNNKELTWGVQYSNSIRLLHDYAEDDTIFIANIKNKINLSILNPIDLAVTKIDRYSEDDKNDIINLSKKGLIEDSILERRVKEALSYYVGNTRILNANLKFALESIKQI